MKRIPRPMIATPLCALVMAMTVTPALAQSPSVDGYDETGVSRVLPVSVTPSGDAARPDALPVKALSSGGTHSPADRPASVGSEALPFTGFGLPLLSLLGGALVAAGALTRRRFRSQVS